MNIKMIALDIDGTTMNSDNILTNRTKEVLLKAMEDNMIIVPATGRTQVGLPEELVGMAGIRYAICSNGATILDLSKNNVIYKNLIAIAAVEKVLNKISKFDMCVDLYYNGKSYTSNKRINNGDHIDDKILTRIPVNDLVEFIHTKNDGIEKILLTFFDMGMRSEIWSMLSKIKEITVTASRSDVIEINSRTANKANALDNLCKKLCISHNNVMAIGDGHNDKEMLDYTPYSVAMENAAYEIKKIAHFITLSNNNDGVAYAIQKYAFNDVYKCFV